MTDNEAVDKLVRVLCDIDRTPRVALQLACCLPDVSPAARAATWRVLQDARAATDPQTRRDLLGLAFMMGFA